MGTFFYICYLIYVERKASQQLNTKRFLTFKYWVAHINRSQCIFLFNLYGNYTIKVSNITKFVQMIFVTDMEATHQSDKHNKTCSNDFECVDYILYCIILVIFK